MKPHAVAFLLGFAGASCNLAFDIQEGIPQCAGIAPGTPLPDTKPGDCRRLVCDATGALQEVPFDDDAPDDGNPCTLEACLNGVVSKENSSKTVPCYDGPTNTENVGACHGGTRACVNGQLAKECSGQILPSLETCLEPGDEDCDGKSDEDGIGCDCEPNSTRSCYSGPIGTAGIGACHAGLQMCNGDGNGYGPCNGEVLPEPDVCDPNGNDENCDGFTTCTGQANLVKQFGSASGSSFLQAMAIDKDGNAILAGKTTGTIDFGGVTANAGSFVVKLNTQALPLWVKSYTNESSYELHLATTTGGSIVLAGRSGGDNSPSPDLKYDNEVINVLDSSDFGFVVLIDSETGIAKWSRGTTLGSAGIHDVATDPAGNIYVVGDYRNQVGFGGKTFSDLNSAFLLKFFSDGTGAWSRTAGSALNATANSVGTDAQGNVYWSGIFTDTIDLGHGPRAFNGLTDFFAASYDPANEPLESATFGGIGADWGTMDVAPSGIRWVGGHSNDSIDMGGGALLHVGGEDAFIAAYGPDGKHQFSGACTGMGYQSVEQIAVNPQGIATIWGLFENTLDCDGEQYMAQSSLDVFIRSIDADYSPRWTRQFHANGGSFSPQDIAADASGGVWVAGTFSGSVDLDIKTISATNNDIFLVHLTQ